ncbi:MAG: hypothetical protein E7640_02150 [Ruminococcaceae bacterium]|nr:hypothetical protein [Oscillospiraceae bacterium]
MDNFEYQNKSVNIGRGARADLRYPVGEPFGEFYAELAEKCLEFATREYSEYSGRGIFYRALFDVVYSGDVTSVLCEITVRERGVGILSKNVFAQNWLNDGRILPIARIFKKALKKSGKINANEYFCRGSEIFAISKKGEKVKTEVKLGNLC